MHKNVNFYWHCFLKFVFSTERDIPPWRLFNWGCSSIGKPSISMELKSQNNDPNILQKPKNMSLSQRSEKYGSQKILIM